MGEWLFSIKRMDRTKIIIQYYNDPDINAAIRKMKPEHLQDDLKAEIFVVICEMTDERLFDIHERGFLKFFIVRTMLNMIKSDRSTFFNKFRLMCNEINETNETNDVQDDEIVVGDVMANLHWYEREIFKIYVENRNIMKIARETGIPYRSLIKTITKVREILKKQIRNGND